MLVENAVVGAMLNASIKSAVLIFTVVAAPVTVLLMVSNDALEFVDFIWLRTSAVKLPPFT